MLSKNERLYEDYNIYSVFDAGNRTLFRLEKWLSPCKGITILLSETLSIFIGQISGSLILVFMPEIMSQDAYIIGQLFSTINVSIEDASSLANIVGFVLIIFALVKDKLIHKAHRFAVGAFAVLGGVELFLRTQVDILQVNIYHFIVEIIVLSYFALLVTFVSKKEKKELR